MGSLRQLPVGCLLLAVVIQACPYANSNGQREDGEPCPHSSLAASLKESAQAHGEAGLGLRFDGAPEKV